jgi:hypothetical protein
MLAVVLMTFCGGSYVGIVRSRVGKSPTEADFLAALLPLVCIPAMFSLGCGLYKWSVAASFNLEQKLSVCPSFEVFFPE